MVKPRQRRKLKNPTIKKRGKSLRHSNKKYNVSGHELIAKNWDKKLTLRQNYAKLGLLSTLNPTTGGIEKKINNVNQNTMDSDVETDEYIENVSGFLETASTRSLPCSSDYTPVIIPPAHLTKLASSLPSTQGIIQRDNEGRIINVILGTANSHEVSQTLQEEEEEDFVWRKIDFFQIDQDELKDLLADQGIQLNENYKNENEIQEIQQEEKIITPIHPIIEKLEKEANMVKSKSSIQPRLASNNELDWCTEMVKKYGNGDDDDTYEKMFRDRKLNIWQLSLGDIRRRIRRWRKQTGQNK